MFIFVLETVIFSLITTIISQAGKFHSIMYYKQPSIYIFEIRIDEPITSLTAVMVAGVCFYAFIVLTKIPIQNKVHLNLKFYFLFMAIATAIGGIIGHAFLYQLSFAWKLLGWITSMFSIAFVERAAIEYARPHISQKLSVIFKWANLIELTIFITITIITLKFIFVEVHSAYGLMIVVSSLNFYIYHKEKSQGSKFFLIAVGFSAISAIVFMNQWGICQWVTHSDISHIFMVISASFFYIGARHIIRNSNKFGNIPSNAAKNL